ncbi:MAG: hypothetical protein EBU46_15105 [Nitrosomonadaceae bacterium]|nr:hypothetical protein [Nitrosomonadaceae bacterium]
MWKWEIITFFPVQLFYILFPKVSTTVLDNIDYQSIPNPGELAGAPDCGANGEALPADDGREEGEAAPEEDCGAKGEFDGEAPGAVFGLD